MSNIFDGNNTARSQPSLKGMIVGPKLPDPIPVEKNAIHRSETEKGKSDPLQIPKEVKEALLGGGD